MMETDPNLGIAETTIVLDSAPTVATIQRQELLREILPACQPQEGSPTNTFTDSELQVLQAALLPENARQHALKNEDAVIDSVHKLNIRGPWCAPPPPLSCTEPSRPVVETLSTNGVHSIPQIPRLFRNAVRAGTYTAPTNGVCAGYLQCNLVVLPAGKVAFDFLLFCQRNSQACPLLEVCEGQHSFVPRQLAAGADLRTDIPKYVLSMPQSHMATVTTTLSLTLILTSGMRSIEMASCTKK
jgi:hypothetical protein